MKLLVIGNSVVDTIDFNGEIKTKPGGIFYTVTALNNFKENQDKISLVTAVDNFNPYYPTQYKREYVQPFFQRSNYSLVEGDVIDEEFIEKKF